MTKINFLKTQHAAKFATIAASMDFEVAVDTAMLTFILPDVLDHNQAVARAYQLDGAKRFLRILQNIAKPEPEDKMERYPEMVKT